MKAKAISNGIVILCLGALTVAAGSDDAMLHEIVAGADANLASIEQKGSVRYRKSQVAYLDGAPQETEESIIEALYSGDRIFWKTEPGNSTPSEWRLMDDDGLYLIHLASSENPAFQNNVVLRPLDTARGAAALIDPRSLGFGVAPSRAGLLSLSDLVRATLKQDARKIRVEREGTEIKLTFYFPPESFARIPANVRGAKEEIWVSPKQGYGVVRQKKWGRPEWPYEEVECEYEQADNGAWIAKRYRSIGRGLEKGRVVQRKDVSVELLSADFDVDVTPDELTLAGIGVPKGSRIQDRVHNREYLLGINAVTEEEVQAEWERMERDHVDSILAYQRHRKQLLTYGILGVIVALVVGVVIYRIRWA